MSWNFILEIKFCILFITEIYVLFILVTVKYIDKVVQ